MTCVIKENEPLASQTVFKIGGPARFFAEIGNEGDFISALKAAHSLGLPWVILGAGSNILVSDNGFNGMVIRWKGGVVSVSGNEVTAEAPVTMARVVTQAINAGLGGFEWGIGIPGTVGGSVRGNAGCFGGEMKDVVKKIKIFNAATGEIEEWISSFAEFGYRASAFKRRPELVVLAATLKLKPGDTADSQRLVREYTQSRAKAQDIGSKCAGCIFKNVLWSRKDIDREKLLKKFPELSQFADLPAISSGFLIDRAGLKGRTVGGAKISERHGNFFINDGNATAEDVLMLIGIAKEHVQRAYGLLLEEEIQYIGFD